MKRVLLYLLALLSSIAASAYDVEIDGIYYNLNADKKEAEVTYKTNNYNSYAGEVVVPSTIKYNNVEYKVTSIGSYAFENSQALISVSIGENVKEIGTDAFYKCIGLTAVSIPENVSNISWGAFEYCSSLSSITIPEKVTIISGRVFEGCSSLTSIIIPEGVTRIAENAFAYCSAIASINIPKSVETIDEGVFEGCSNLTSVTIPEGVKAIASRTFFNSGLTSIIIPEGVTHIAERAFYGCSKLVSVKIPASVVSISNGVFEGCTALSSAEFASIDHLLSINFHLDSSRSPLYYAKHLYFDGQEVTDIIIPDEVSTLTSVFQGFKGLKSIVIGNGITKIPHSAFRGCTGLTSVTIPESVTTIDDAAFLGCSALESIYIPYSVTIIGYDAFMGCSNAESITVAESNPVVDSRNNCNALIDTKSNTLILGCKNTVIPNGVTMIGQNAFNSCSDLISIVIPESAETIEHGAFRGCSNLQFVSIGSRVTDIGYFAFEECTSLTSLIINSESIASGYIQSIFGQNIQECVINAPITEIQSSAFLNCTALKFFKIPETTVNIGEDAFYNCSSLTSITIPEKVENIEEEAFYGCSGLTSVTINSNTIVSKDFEFDGIPYIFGSQVEEYMIGENATSIGDYAFNDCSANITLSKKLTSIGKYAFAHCSGLTSLTIPSSVMAIGNNAFYSCTNLSFVDIQSRLLNIDSDWFSWCDNIATVSIAGGTIGKSAFANKTKLTSLTLGEGVTSIGEYAFRDCSSLSDLTLGANVTSIEKYAFSGCSNLSTVTLPNSLTSIGDGAFRDTKGLKSITIPNSVVTIGSGAFIGSGAMEAVHIRDMAVWCATSFGENWNGYSSDDGFNLYQNGEKVTNLVIPKEATTINKLAFFNCKGIESIMVEDKNEVYDSRESCNAIIETESNTLQKGCKNSFVPSDVTAIADYAFLNCDGLTSVTLGSDMQFIGQQAFDGCKLRNVLVKNATPPTASGSSFSEQTFYHTTLYIHTDSWDDYAYDNSWYRFINIRETATEESQLSTLQAYTLMDTKTFNYSVYDPVNECIGSVSSVSGIDENNPYHCWQVINSNGQKYLYNIGAKKFVAYSEADSSLSLTDNNTSIEMSDGADGIFIGGDAAHQWAMVSNERMQIDQNILNTVTGMHATVKGEQTGKHYYGLNGQLLRQPKKGLNIIRTEDGRTMKAIKM